MSDVRFFFLHCCVLSSLVLCCWSECTSCCKQVNFDNNTCSYVNKCRIGHEYVMSSRVNTSRVLFVALFVNIVLYMPGRAFHIFLN